VRQYLQAADEDGVELTQALDGVAHHVIGVDVHPVAVTLARVTYLLALGLDRIRSPDRGPITIPVYLGDSLQWGQIQSVFSSGALTVPTEADIHLFAAELRFPESLLAGTDARRGSKSTLTAAGSPRTG
jgi:hypothetical protein